MRYLSTLVKAI